MAQIQPIVIPFQGTANYLLVTSMPYALGVDTTTGVQWALMEETVTEEPVLDGEGNPVLNPDNSPQMQTNTSYKPMGAAGTIALTEAEFAGWGTDDSYLINLVAGKIGVNLI